LPFFDKPDAERLVQKKEKKRLEKYQIKRGSGLFVVLNRRDPEKGFRAREQMKSCAHSDGRTVDTKKMAAKK